MTLIYSNGKFLSKNVAEQTSIVNSKRRQYARGDVVMVRFVKAVSGFGVTVQMDEKSFGTIQVCELNDEISSNVVSIAQKRGLFRARVLEQDKKGRL